MRRKNKDNGKGEGGRTRIMEREEKEEKGLWKGRRRKNKDNGKKEKEEHGLWKGRRRKNKDNG